MPQLTTPMRAKLPDCCLVTRGPPLSPWHESLPPRPGRSVQNNNNNNNINNNNNNNNNTSSPPAQSMSSDISELWYLMGLLVHWWS